MLCGGWRPSGQRTAGEPGSTGGESRAKLFARKFDADADAEVLDLLDRERVAA